jgi:hypothetical protein
MQCGQVEYSLSQQDWPVLFTPHLRIIINSPISTNHDCAEGAWCRQDCQLSRFGYKKSRTVMGSAYQSSFISKLRIASHFIYLNVTSGLLCSLMSFQFCL